MNIQTYIAQLLHRYQCVTIPGFGAFLTEIQSAHWVPSTSSFYPPKKRISFNANLTNNDGLLANHIAQAEKTSYGYAVSAIQFEVMNWKKALDADGILAVHNIGSFSLNTEGSLVFKPLDTVNYLTSSFGLSSFVSAVIHEEALAPEVIVKETKVISLSEETEEQEQSNRPSYLKYAAIFVLGLGLTGTAAMAIYQNKIEAETVLVESAVQKQVQNKIQEATFFIKTPMPAVTLSIKENKLPYHVVAGAFRDEKNAEKVYLKLSKEGYKARRLEVNKFGLYPVLYGSFPTLAEAEKLKRKVQQEENPDTWVLIQSL